MNEESRLNLIGRIQSLLINLDEQEHRARPEMLWLLLGIIEGAFLSNTLTEAEYNEYQRLVGEMLAFAGGPE